MKLFITAIFLAFLATFATAVSEQKPVVVSYPKDTPHSVMEQAMDAIKKAGGVITHEYNLIKGFAAMASEQALESVQSMGSESNVLIEDDKTFHTADN